MRDAVATTPSPWTPESSPIRGAGFWIAGGIGATLSLLGAGVIFGWHSGRMDLVQVRSDYPQMQYATAMAFLLGGLALFALVRGWRRLVLVLGAILFLFGLSLILEVLSGTSFRVNAWLEHLPYSAGAHPARPAPITSLCWVVTGLLLMLMGGRSVKKRFRVPAVWLGGMALLFLSSLKLLSYFVGFVGAYSWGDYMGMAFHTALGMAFLAIGLLAGEIGLDTEGSLIESRWLPMVTGAASALAVVLVWEGLQIDQYHQMESNALLVAETLKHQLVARIDSRMRELDRMALRWEMRSGTPRGEWEADAGRLIDDQQSFQEIEWLDAAGRLQWAVPDRMGLHGRIAGDSGFWNAGQALEKARRERALVCSPTIDLMGGGRGFLVYRPLFSAVRPGPGGFDGFLVGVLRSGDLFRGVFSEGGFAGYSVAICEGDEPVYLSPGFATALEKVQAQTAIEVCGHRWSITVSPSAILSERAGSGLPLLILFLGLSVSLAMMACVRAFQQSLAKTAAANAAREGLQREVAERERVEEQLRHSEEQYRFMVTNVKDYAIFLIDPLGYAASWNPGVEKIKGYTKEEFIGKHVSICFRPEDNPEETIRKGLRIAAETGRYESEGWLARKDGSTYWASMTLTALRDDRGQLLGFTEFTHDLTEKKRAEDRLREESRKAQEASRLKGEFLTNMTHELRTPLNAIIGFTQFLSGESPGPLNEKQKDFLQDVENSGRHLLRLINDILDLAKIEAGKIDLAVESFSVRALVDEVVGVLHPLIVEKYLDLETEFSMGDDTVVLDVQKIRQALYNLLSNAIKFTDRGGSIFLQAHAAEAGFFQIRVIDTGIGIRKEDFSRLFVEFQQLDSGSNRNYPGTGLGLVLVKKIVESHGGRVEVASEFGRGTTFTVVLPRIYQNPAVKPIPHPELDLDS